MLRWSGYDEHDDNDDNDDDDDDDDDDDGDDIRQIIIQCNLISNQYHFCFLRIIFEIIIEKLSAVFFRQRVGAPGGEEVFPYPMLGSRQRKG